MADRISKYFDDAKEIITEIRKGKNIKLVNEVKKLSNWLQKHQNECVSDGIKGKLMSTVEIYYRHGSSVIVDNLALEAICILLETYLQLPEGKLVTAKDKKKALAWLQEFSARTASCDPTKSTKVISKWFIDTVHDDESLTLLSTLDSENWKEHFVAINAALFLPTIKELSNDCDVLVLDIDENTNAIVAVASSNDSENVAEV